MDTRTHYYNEEVLVNIQEEVHRSEEQDRRLKAHKYSSGTLFNINFTYCTRHALAILALELRP